MKGSPGHRKSERLVEAEAYRRIMSGAAPEMLAEFSRQLSDWFRESYPMALPMTPDAVERDIREIWHRRHEMIRGG